MAKNSKPPEQTPEAIAESDAGKALIEVIRQAKRERLEECFRKADSIVKSLRRQKNNAAAMGAEMVAQALRLIDPLADWNPQAAIGDPRAASK